MSSPPLQYINGVGTSRHAHNTCRNCGCIGHLYKECPQPITSYGIICYRICPVTRIKEYVMIQRKDSLCFMEFIRGKYDLKNIEYICQLFKDMTFDERQLILSKSFNELWNHVWYQQYLLRHTTEYNFARSKFDALNTGFYVNDTFVDLNYIIASTDSQHCEPEWGFPKGRRRIREEDSACAVREFCEETGCKASSIELSRSLTTFEEVFFGTNNVLYKHVYYVGKMTHDGLKTMNINKNNLNQVREVRAVEWFTYEEALDHIRNHNKERKQLFTRVHQTICNIENIENIENSI